MDKLEKRLKDWRRQQLIDTDTLQRILAYESGRGHDGWQWRTLLILGLSIIGIGVVSLIAANWASIPDSIKLGADFLLLALVATGIYLNRGDSGHAWREGLIVLFQVLCLASIGLIAQVYHLSGKPWLALGYWAAMTLPITLFARAQPARWLWAGLLLLAFGMASNDLLALRENPVHRFSEDAIFSAWLLTTLFAGILHSLSEWLNWRRFRLVFGFAWLLLGLGLVAALDIIHSLHETSLHQLLGLYIAGGLAAVLLVLLALRRDLRPMSRVIIAAVVLLVLAAVHPSLLFDPGEGRLGVLEGDDIRAAVITLTVLTGGLAISSLQGWRWAFQLFTLLIGVRFYAIYLQAFGGLAATGVGLIVSGALIIAMVYLWRRSVQLFSRVREIAR